MEHHFTSMYITAPRGRNDKKTKEQEDEIRRANERVKRLGGRFWEMAGWLEDFLKPQSATKPNLMELAKKISNEDCKPIDRDARRRKECLICWFDENFPEGLPRNDEDHPIFPTVQPVVTETPHFGDLSSDSAEIDLDDWSTC
jgi:hypothetical protein